MPHTSPPIGIVGAGAVATALGGRLHAAGAPVVALASRTLPAARRAAAAIGPSVQVVSCTALPHHVQRVIVAVTDDGIGPVAATLATAGMRGIVLHTSGARGLAPCEPLRAVGVACGMLHPLQTVVPRERGATSFSGVAFGVAGDGPAGGWARALVGQLGGEVLELCADDLAAYHAGAVMASNALTAAIDAALALLVQAGIERDAALRALGPLCRASVENALELGPAGALTGPVVRGDASTVAAHLNALDRAPGSVEALYRATARHLLSLARERQLPPAAARSIARLLQA